MNSTINLSNDSLHKKAVVSLDDGRRVGYVDDLLLDPQKLSLAAFVIKGDDGQSVLPVEHIHNVGEDAITVEGMSSTQSAANSNPGLRSFAELRGHKVVDSAGTLLGSLHSVEFDAASAAIIFLEVQAGGVFGIGAQSVRVPSKDICSFGPDLVTVNVASATSPSAEA